MLNSSSLLIGCGSIGKRHLEHLVSIFTKVVVVDPNKDTAKYIANKFPKKVVYRKSLNECSTQELQDILLAVIANWGPDHYQTFRKLTKFKIENYIIEKPLVTSVSELFKLEQIVFNEKLNVLVNQGWQDTNLANRLKVVANKLKIGRPVAIFVTGGARCHSTAGSHFIHLANTIFESSPIKVNGFFESLPINPRSNNLDYLDGNLFALYDSGKKLSINFTNLSSISGEVQIYYKDCLGILNEQHFVIFSRDKNREFSEVITRYGNPEIKIFEGDLFAQNKKNQGQLAGIYRSILQGSKIDNLKSFKNHCQSNKVLLYGLISNRTGRTLFLDQKLPLRFQKMKFKIS